MPCCRLAETYSEFSCCFSPPRGFGCYRAIHRAKTFSTSQWNCFPANVACLFPRTKLGQGIFHCYLQPPTTILVSARQDREGGGKKKKKERER